VDDVHVVNRVKPTMTLTALSPTKCLGRPICW